MLRARWPRLASLAVGAGLTASTLAFRADSSAGFDRLMLGLFVCCCAVSALWAPWFRFVNLGIGVWLAATAPIFRQDPAFLRLGTLAAGGALIVLSALRSPPRLVSPTAPFVGYRP